MVIQMYHDIWIWIVDICKWNKLKLTVTWHYVLLTFLCAYCGYFCHEILNVYVYVYFYVAF
jgi:hypothetical protein